LCAGPGILKTNEQTRGNLPSELSIDLKCLYRLTLGGAFRVRLVQFRRHRQQDDTME
jgi:hypothetical protein